MPIDQDALKALQARGLCNLCRREVLTPSVHLCPAEPDETQGSVLFVGCFSEEPGFAVLQRIPRRLVGRFGFERRPGEQTILRIGDPDSKDELVFRVPVMEELPLRLALS